MKNYIYYLPLVATLFALSCQSNSVIEESPTIYVSIAPLGTIVERITCDDFPVEVVVPSGASVESYELTPKQFVALNSAQMIFSTGLLEFEESIISRVERRERVTNLSRGIELIAGSCSHAHTHANHSHGVDPHIWTSPRELIQISQNCYQAIAAKYPDSTKYERAYRTLKQELQELDRECGEAIAQSGVTSIYIYHPALTYFARAYGVEQVAIESEGKEPSAKRLAQVIEMGREQSVGAILYQSQYPVSCVEIVADDLGAQAVEIDPLASDPLSQIRFVVELITR
ncbi:MAG: zinc ABC transporter substrate-binding protein [Rikenellaceae bacterium]